MRETEKRRIVIKNQDENFNYTMKSKHEKSYTVEITLQILYVIQTVFSTKHQHINEQQNFKVKVQPQGKSHTINHDNNNDITFQS